MTQPALAPEELLPSAPVEGIAVAPVVTAPSSTAAVIGCGSPEVPSTSSFTVTSRALDVPAAPTQSKVSVATTADAAVMAGALKPAA
jgi:hypothetical protein